MPPNEEKKDELKGQDDLPVLRTFKSDSSSYVNKEGVSMVDVAAAQAKKNWSAVLTPASFFSEKNIILAGAVLFVICAALAVFFIFGKKEKTLPPTPLPKPVLVAEFEKEATLDNLLSVLKEPAPKDKFVYISVVQKDGVGKRPATTKELFEKFNFVFPGNLPEIFEGGFMFGVFNKPVLIFRIKSYEKAFISMMKWENSMADDLENILAVKNTASLPGFFTDKEIRNRDSRVLNDSDGNPLALYSFINREYLIMASDLGAMEEVIRRFSSPQYLNK